MIGITVDPSIPLWRIKHDYEMNKSFKKRPAEVFRLSPFKKVLLTEELQNLWFHQIVIEGSGLTNAQLLQVWRWLTDHNRAFTNGVGPDILRDYVLHKRMNKGLPGIFPLVCGGNVVTGAEDGTDLVVRTLGEAEIHDPELSHKKYPYLIHYATVATTKKLPDKTFVVSRFSTKIWQGRNAPVPLLAAGEVRYPLSKLVRIAPGFAPDPYHP